MVFTTPSHSARPRSHVYIYLTHRLAKGPSGVSCSSYRGKVRAAAPRNKHTTTWCHSCKKNDNRNGMRYATSLLLDSPSDKCRCIQHVFPMARCTYTVSEALTYHRWYIFHAVCASTVWNEVIKCTCTQERLSSATAAAAAAAAAAPAATAAQL